MNRFSDGKRQLPDLAADAAPGSGYFIVDEGVPERIGGTSAASPFIAASFALVQQFLEQRRLGPLPYLNPVLYRLAASPTPDLFHDVIRGGNRFYRATPGWDYATGLGSPRVVNLARAIAATLNRSKPTLR